MCYRVDIKYLLYIFLKFFLMGDIKMDHDIISGFELTDKQNKELERLEEQSKTLDFSRVTSISFRRKINRLFRERIGIKTVPHPEVDNAYEHIRSRIVIVIAKVITWLKTIFC